MSPKRRVDAGTHVDSMGRGQKRRRVSIGVADIDNPEFVKNVGLELLEQIKKATDENGRLIATSFLHLPDRKRDPKQFEATPDAIALDTIEGNLKRHRYPALSSFEEDLKRMIDNARLYIEESSTIVSDADKILEIIASRKAQINSHSGKAKGIENLGKAKAASDFQPDRDDSKARKDSAIQPIQQSSDISTSNPVSAKSGITSLKLTMSEQRQSPAGFEGNTLQKAQEKIVFELMNLKDKVGREVSLPFLYKPDRNLYKDYYEIIQHPTSLRTILKQVRGTHTRRNLSRTPHFRTWQSFENEVSFIWRNAREFNEDGSEIVVFAGILEEYFKQRVAQAKQVVPNPPQQPDEDAGTPRIRLKVGERAPGSPPAKLTIRLPRPKSATPTKEESRQSSMAADGDIVREQGVNILRNQSQEQQPSTAVSPPRSDTTRGKSEVPIGETSHPPSFRESSQASQEPSRLAMPSPYSPSISASDPLVLGPGKAPSPQASESVWSSHTALDLQIPAYRSQSPSNLPDSVLRLSGKDATTALIRNVTIRTQPTIKGPDFCVDIPPSQAASQQTVAVNLPRYHHSVAITVDVASSTAQRQVKFVGSLGMQRLRMTAGNQSRPTFDIHLNPGITKVDLEAIASSTRGVPRNGPAGSDVEYEKVTLFLNVLP